MVRVLKWAGIILVVLFLALVGVVLVLNILRFGGMPMMARGFRGPFMLGRFGILGGWIFMLGRMLIPLALIVLLVLGGIAIGRALAGPRAAVVTTCKNCGRPVQADWNNCPYCGTKLKNDEPAPPSQAAQLM